MDKIKTEPADILRDKLNRLEEIFPELITEKNLDGEIIKAFDFDALKDIFNDKAADSEHYVFNWVGKTSARIKAYQPTNKTLRPCLDESRDWNTTRNLYIEGENLEVLKLLQQSYLHKVKMIYIDPPYNTGNDFIYRDNFTMDEDDLNAQIELFDDDGNKNFVKNPATNPRVHSDWCSMIYSRLLLTRNLLADDGVIFISIDDNEQANLKKICDEVFGEKNFIANAVLQRSTNGMGDKKGFALSHEYILCYQRSELTEFYGLTPNDDYLNSFNQVDSHGKYKIDGILMKKGAGSRREDSPTLFFPLYYSPTTGQVSLNPLEGYKEKYPIKSNGSEGRWTWGKEKILNEGYRLYASSNGTIYVKDYLTEERRMKIKSIISGKEYITDKATNEIRKIFDNKVFDTPKPIKLIKDLMDIILNSNDIVMDFFSGSATTAHAVMELNAQDGGKRQFIMVQLPEKCDEKSEAYKAGYKNICDIGKERIRRAGDKIKSAAPLTTTDLDIGFRVLKLDESNYRDVAIDIAELRQEDIMNYVENIKGDRNGYDLLFDCLLRWGRELTLPHSVEEFDGATIHNYGGELAACFDKNITRRVIEYIAKKKVARAVFRDACFARDADKINADAIFKCYSPNTKVEVL